MGSAFYSGDLYAIFHPTIMHMPLQIHENIPLAPLTTLGVGGPARFLARAQTENHISEALEFARTNRCPVFVLGGGSNIVVSDSGYPGLVLKIEITGIQYPDGEQGAEIAVGAGVEWDAFVQHCVDRNLAGIECLSGIPGTVGGIPIQNVGAYGQEGSETISTVRAWDRESGKVVELSNRECRFAYRSSIFNTTCLHRYIVLKVGFSLRPDGRACLQYADLRQRLGGAAQSPTLRQVRDTVIEIRKSKAMVVREEDPDSRSAGSFFKNPVLDRIEFETLELQACSRGLLAASDTMPRFDIAGGKVKLPAAWLIEHSGFGKGYVQGAAGISRKHSLALVNRGGATARDIVDLMHRIQGRVLETFGVELRPEPIFVGFEKEVR